MSSRIARQRRLSMLGLLIALPLAMWVASGDHWLRYREQNHQQIVDAPANADFTFAGSDWRLESAATLSADASDAIPPDISYVSIIIAVTASDAAAADRLSRCTVMLTSNDGRRWSLIGSGPRSTSGLSRSCGGTYRDQPEPGKTYRFEQVFAVPSAVADEVEPLVILPKEKADGPKPPLLRLRRR